MDDNQGMCRAIVILAAVALTGCGDRALERLIVGDWLQCKIPDCGLLDTTGYRFQDDGVWLALFVNGQSPTATPEPEGSYCHMSRWRERHGTYTYDGVELVKDGSPFPFTILGDRATLQLDPPANSLRFKRIVPSRLAGHCR